MALSMAAFLAGQPSPVMAQHMTVPGKASVDPNGGAGYSIPISVPPGTAGLAPTLSFQYNNQSGNGLLGIGWSLAGLPAVGRCPRTIAQDGVMGAVNYDANDRFCLDGQRLIALNSGAYGADGTEYRTEIESFSRVISHGTAGTGPAWFEVHTKSGQILEFGNTADSQVLAQGKPTVRSWGVDKASDTKGNYFTVSYTQDAANGQAYPARIDYTGNAGTSLQPYNSARFVYAARPDVSALYNAGSLMETTQRLTDVQTYAGSSLVADYRLAYSTAIPNPSILASITLCAADGSCLPPTSFTVTDSMTLSGPAPTFTYPSNVGQNGNVGTPPTANTDPFTGDFNGDGKTDFAFGAAPAAYIFLANGDGTFTTNTYVWPIGSLTDPPSTAYTLLTGDFNGDGKTDIAYAAAIATYVFLSNGDGTFSASTFNYPGSIGDAGDLGIPPAANTFPFTGDFNGDGKTDLAFAFNNAVSIFLSNGDGTFTTNTYAWPNGWFFGDPPQAAFFPIVGDFDGDGKTDFAFTAPAGGQTLYTFRSNGDGTFAGSSVDYPFSIPAPGGPSPIVGDFNGDGKTDIIFTSVDGSTGDVLLSKGDGTFATSTITWPADLGQLGWAWSSTYTPVVADFNGDGKTDFVLPTATTMFYMLGNGDGTFSLTELTYPNGWNFGAPPSANYTPVTGDFNADGKIDFAFAGATPLYMLLSTSTPPNFLLSTVTNGLGATTTFTYQPLTNSSIYTKGSGSTYPISDVLAPIYVVSRVDNSNGIGGTLSAKYAYAGAKMDNSGRGFLGFQKVTATDLQTNIVKTTTYRQDYPYTALAVSETQTLSGATLGTTANSYGSASLGGTRYQIFLTQSEASSTDLDGSALPTVTTSYQYDAFSNATQVAVSASDGHSKTTINSYTNDTTNWLLGRLTSAVVTSVAPAPPVAPPTSSQNVPADMTVAVTHSGVFQAGQTGATYAITVSNGGTGPTIGTVTVTDTLPSGLSATAMGGTGWSCTLTTLTCSRADALAAGASYPAVTLTVSVAATAPATVANVATVSGGGETNSGNDTAIDQTMIAQAVTISSNANNFNLWNYLGANGIAGTGPLTVNVTIAAGVVVGSTSTSVPAFDTGAFPSGSTVQITNNGTIVGAGGTGGVGGSDRSSIFMSECTAPPPSSGSSGGPGLSAQIPVTLANNGAIWGGGGGGAAEVADSYGNWWNYDGGGGGGGAGTGSGGAPGVFFPQNATTGGAGSSSAGGAGGVGTSGDDGIGDFNVGASGGTGGGPGQSGSNGGTPSGSIWWTTQAAAGAFGVAYCLTHGAVGCICSSGAGGGSPGAAVLGNSLITWTVTGDRRGALN